MHCQVMYTSQNCRLLKGDSVVETQLRFFWMKLLTNYNADLFPLHFSEIIPSLELLLNSSVIKLVLHAHWMNFTLLQMCISATLCVFHLTFWVWDHFVPDLEVQFTVGPVQETRPTVILFQNSKAGSSQSNSHTEEKMKNVWERFLLTQIFVDTNDIWFMTDLIHFGKKL